MNDIDIPEAMDTYIEPEHIETVFEGLIDTIEGNEGMSLTSAQIYLNGVMMANGTMSSRQYTGNEGIFQAIGDGLNKVWEYIKSLFRKIFGGEKKKGAEAASKKLDDKIESTEKKLDKMAKDPIPPINSVADLDKFMGKVEKKAQTTPPSPAKDDLDKGIKETREAINNLKEKGDKAAKNMGKDSIRDFMPPELRAAMERVLDHTFKANLYDKKKAIEADGRLKASIEKLQLIKNRHQETGNKTHLAGTIQRYIDCLAGLDPIDKVHDISTANAWLAKAKRCKEAMGNIWGGLFNDQDVIKRQIAELEGKINHFDKSDAQDPLKKEINELKEHLVDVTNADNHFSVISVSMGAMVEVIDKAIVVVT